MDQHATVPYPLCGYQIQTNELMRLASHVAAIISSKLYTTVGSRPAAQLAGWLGEKTSLRPFIVGEEIIANWRVGNSASRDSCPLWL
jgi:hypothetical protein